MKTIFEDEDICITDLEKDFDFIALIQNKSNKDLCIDFMEDDTDTLQIKSQNWLGILADNNGYNQLDKLYKGQYHIKEE